MIRLFVVLLLFLSPLSALDPDIPLLYRGRVHPAGAYANQELVLPCQRGEWLPLEALKTESGNFTLYPDETFQEIQKAYLLQDVAKLSAHLRKAYAGLAGKPMRKAHGKTLYYPTFNQLYAELLLFRIPFLEIILLLYVLGALFGLPGAFVLHTAYLLLRCYILARPPVSNMYETLLYVPWIIGLSGLIFSVRRAASASAALILMILIFCPLKDNMENVQAVLDSQYWLTIHVLMVVASYGFFILGGVLAHLYFYNKDLAKPLLHTLYIGTGLLIVGTILGGVWAAQSWGRFWDWDPKESWAFISACIYLILIHLYRFKQIGPFGLAIGAILGLQAILFTWYGVNYILGTGLHSYGFGSGGNGFFAAFVLLEFAFIILRLSFNRKAVKLSHSNIEKKPIILNN